VTLELRTTGAGSFSAHATFVEALKVTGGHGKHRHTHVVHRTVTYGDASGDMTRAGTVSLTLSPTVKALALLKARHTLRLTIVVTFSPTGGSASRTIEHATVTAPTRARLRHAQLLPAPNIYIPAVDEGLGSAYAWECR